MHCVYENLNGNGLPHTVGEWYTHCVHEIVLNENRLLHAVEEWHVYRIHGNG